MSPEIFSSAYTKLYRPLCLYAVSYLKVMQAAEDVVQDSFVKLYFTELTEPECKPYLLITVRNRCINYGKHSKIVRVTHKLLGFVTSYKTKDNLDQCIRFETMSLIYEEIENLPPERKKIFKMAYLDMLGNEEIATELDISIHTVRDSKAMALKYLRGKFGSNFKYKTFINP